MQQPITRVMRSSVSSGSVEAIFNMSRLLRVFVPSWLPLAHGVAICKGADIERHAVGINRHRPIPVGPEDLRPNGPVAVEYFWHRVAEVVASPRADDSDGWPHGAHEGLGARREAPVMGNLHDPEARGRDHL